MDELKEIKVFEVDLAWVQDVKKQKIKKYFGFLPANVNYVAIDFNSQTLNEVLQKCNFDFSEPTFIIWEGVTQYITKDAAEQTLDFISRTPKGSYLVFTYILESVIKKESTIEGTREFIDYLIKKKTPWLFGIKKNSIEAFVQGYNLKLIDDIGASYYQEHYLQKIGRQLLTTEIERVVLAKIN